MKELNVLEIKNVSKSFVGIHALREVSLEARQGETLALLGENGAGKSTLIKIILGVEQANSGEVWFDGQLKNYSSSNEAYKDGISAMFQETSLVPELTVLQNVFLGAEILKSFGCLDEEVMIQTFDQTCKDMGLQLDPHTLVSSLSAANQKLVEILKALTKQSRFIIMDEPTDSLSLPETERLLNIIQNLKSQDIGVLYISHKLEEVFKVADRITVLRDGQNVFTSQTSNCSVSEVITKMVGEPVEDNIIEKNKIASRSPVLKLTKLGVGATLKDISFDVHPGEVVGITGLIGAGKTKLAKTLFGISSYDEGEINLCGKLFKPVSPKEAINEGIYLVPEDRKTQGLNLDFEIFKNITITNLPEFLGSFGLIKDREITTSENLLSSMSFRGGSSTRKVKKLSGGNQQKVVVSKWLHNQPKLLILDEPTKGMDVKARQEIMNIVKKLAKNDCSVLYLTSDFNEVKQASDRLLLLHDGRLVGEVGPEESVEKIMKTIFNFEN